MFLRSNRLWTSLTTWVGELQWPTFVPSRQSWSESSSQILVNWTRQFELGTRSFRLLWEPKFALSISVELGKIGNPKFPRGPRYLLNNTPSNQNTKYTDETKYENRKRKQRMSYSESTYERYNKVRALAARAVGEFPSSNNLRLQKPSWVAVQ